MSDIKVYFEIGHVASLKCKKSPEGFTHDWEVFVRGAEGADISNFVEKVVFHLHETFPKPHRVVKEPPFSIKESGYAGFTFPIELYLKNKDEPKRIKFTYDLSLQNSGSLKDRYIFQNPNEEFRKKLIRGGGMNVSHTFYSNPDQENRSRDSFTEEKQQLVSKPKLSSEGVKKHKNKDYKEELPHKSNSFENLFGAPLQKPSKISPEPKKNDKNANVTKSDKKDKDRSNSEKKSKHEYKESKLDKEKNKGKEEKDKNRPEKVKTHQETGKEKSTNKRSSDRPPSPTDSVAKKRCISPSRKMSPPRSNSVSSVKDEYKPAKIIQEPREQKKLKTDDRPPEIKVDKKKKDKKHHEKDKERKDKKEHKKEVHKPKESPKESKDIPKELMKSKETIREKETSNRTTAVKEKSIKTEKLNKFSIANLQKTPPPENEEHFDNHKSKDKSDSERKHKHKKKDKKRDESKEKHKESSKDKKHKHEKIRETPTEKMEVSENRETPNLKDRSLHEQTSPISIDTASQCSSKSGIKISNTGTEDIRSCHSDSENSVVPDDEDTKIKIDISPALKRDLSSELELEIDPETEMVPKPNPQLEPQPIIEITPPETKEKTKKHKDKSSRREEKRRKRKSMATEEDATERKLMKTNDYSTSNNNETERGESSFTIVETKVQDNGVSSSLGEDAEPGELSPDYLAQLRGLQQRITSIKSNEELDRVVNLIAETGRYEVTTQTFDFDLCLLDRSTVQQLIQLVGC